MESEPRRGGRQNHAIAHRLPQLCAPPQYTAVAVIELYGKHSIFVSILEPLEPLEPLKSLAPQRLVRRGGKHGSALSYF